MAIKKTELYSSLWASCNELRGGMDASQYKDYVLVMLFIKYISDKWGGQLYSPITIPQGASFADMVELKGNPNIGELINTQILAPLEEVNRLSDFPDFNDVTKLGSGKEMVDRLSNLIAIFENPALDFSKNKSQDDDILGDAYEFLMRHFAQESGKSKGQFYTPAEVSRTMAAIIGINEADTNSDITVYDPTCGSGSLLLRVGSETDKTVTLYGQEKEATTAGLARMNMILHNNPTAEIAQGNTLSNPLFQENGNLKIFDFVVANPPFSDKRWSSGLTLPDDEPFNRFADYGTPPSKNGDYAYLLHIIRSLKRNGKGAIILPHGVLFRGHAEAEIRKNIIKKGYIKGIIGLPANLFYGTGIPAAIIVIDKENAANRKGLFMINASEGFIKDGNKNRLREQDVRKITDVFNTQAVIPGYSRMVSVAEIEENDFNLNIPRYIENQEAEDIQDIEAHLKGGIPNVDIDALAKYWSVFPTLRKTLFAPLSNRHHSALAIEQSQVRDTIFSHPEFKALISEMDKLFANWKSVHTALLKEQGIGLKPKELIVEISNNLLRTYQNIPLINEYDIYQHLMSYWYETMQDDLYIVAADGWEAKTYRIEVMNARKKMVDKGWTCDLVPKALVINRYFDEEKEAIAALEAEKESIASELTEMEEEHSAEEGYFAELEKVNKTTVNGRIKELKGETDVADELKVLRAYIHLLDKQSALNRQKKEAEAVLDDKLYAKYPTLTPQDVKQLVVDEKWMQTIEGAIKGEIDHISQTLTNRIKELAERYDTSLPAIDEELDRLENKVNAHLEKMGFEL